jgi:hypothetical protein
MAILSAGVRVNELDFSEYAAQLGLTRFCALGGATKGPVDTPTLVTNEPELIEKFGAPLVTDYGLQAAIQYLKEGDQLIYTRVADKTPVTGVASAEVEINGPSAGVAAVDASGNVSFTASTNPSDGETVTIHDTVPQLNLENDNDGALGNVALSVPVGGARIAATGMDGGDPTHPAVGTLKLIGSAMPLSGDQVIVSDGVTPTTFEFNTVDPVTEVWVDITGITDPYEAMAALHAAINGEAFNVSSVNYANTHKYTFEFDDNASYLPGNVPVLIGTDAAETLTNLIAAIALTSVDVNVADGTVTIPQMDVTHKTGGIDGNAVLVTDGVNIGTVGLTGGVDAIPGGVIPLMDAVAATPGTWANNNVSVIISDTSALNAPVDAFDLVVEAVVDKSGARAIVERFVNLVLDPASERYAEKVIEEGILNEVDPSEYITLDVITDGTPTNATYQLGTSPATEGRNGITGLTTADYVGTISGTSATGLKAVQNNESIEFNVLAVPGVSHRDVVNEMIATAEKRLDSICLVDAPFGLTKAEAIDWHNGDLATDPEAPLVALDTSYGTFTWSWSRVYDEYNKQNIWLPTSGYVAARFAYTDRVAAPWFPAAGHNRGIIDSDAVEYSPSQDDRDEMCPIFTGDNRVNPIVDFVGQGPTLFGNRTLQRKWSQLTDVHVRRLLLRAEKLCATSVKYLVFEPNDPTTWKKFQTVCNKHLGDIAAQRGLESFKVVCDGTTNPPTLRRRRSMKGKLYLTPTPGAEGIEMDFAVFASGVEFSE